MTPEELERLRLEEEALRLSQTSTGGTTSPGLNALMPPQNVDMTSVLPNPGPINQIPTDDATAQRIQEQMLRLAQTSTGGAVALQQVQPPVPELPSMEPETQWVGTRPEEEYQEQTRVSGMMDLPSPEGWVNAVKDQQRAIQEGVNAEQEGQSLVADMYEKASRDISDAQTALKDLEVKRQEEMNKQIERLEELKSQKINPNQYWENAETGTKIALVIASIAGGMAQAINGTPNAALNSLNTLISRDINAQKENLRKGISIQGSLLDISLKKFQNEEQAILASKILASERIQNQLKGVQARTNSQLVKNQADALISKLEAEKEEKLYQLQLSAGLKFNIEAQKRLKDRASLAYQQGPGKLINERITDPKQKGEAFKELKEITASNKTLEAIANVENVLKKYGGVQGFKTMLPFSDAIIEYESSLTNLEQTARQQAKSGGHFSDEDAQALLGFFPKKRDLILGRSDIRFDELRKFINGKKNPGVVLKTYGIDPRFGEASRIPSINARPQTASQIPQTIRSPSSSLSELVDKSSLAPKDAAAREDIKKAIATAAEGDKTLENLLFAIGKVESNFNSTAKAKTSTASGMFQQIDATAARYGSIDAKTDAKGNVIQIYKDNRGDYWEQAKSVAKHLKSLANDFDNNPFLMAMGYYRGEGAVKQGLLLGNGEIKEDKVPPNYSKDEWKTAINYAKNFVSILGEEPKMGLKK